MSQANSPVPIRGASKVRGNTMRFRLPNRLLIAPAAICFVEAAKVPKNDPGPVLTGVLGFLLLLRALAVAPQPASLIISGCIAAAITVAGDEGLINANRPLWVVILLVIVVVIFREAIRMRRKGAPRGDEDSTS
jgi:hypothetical protein